MKKLEHINLVRKSEGLSILDYKDITNEKKIKEYIKIHNALKDKDPNIRLEAYRKFGFTQDAFNDEDYIIRREAYRKLGFTPDALKDKKSIIQFEAQQYFKNKLKKHLAEKLQRPTGNLRKE
jgi:hypothetical protein